jgi:hypothetical protein
VQTQSGTMAEIAAAEERMSSIENRILGLEANKSSADSSEVAEALQEYQKQMLIKLKVVRDKLNETSSGGDINQVKKERDEAVAQTKLDKKEIEKLNYRVQHLIKSLNAEEAGR